MTEEVRHFGGGGQGAQPAAPFLNPTHQLRLCVPVVEPTVPRARNLYLRAARRGLWAEIRLDYLAKPDVKKLFRTLPGQVIATNRLATEGGKWPGTEAERRSGSSLKCQESRVKRRGPDQKRIPRCFRLRSFFHLRDARIPCARREGTIGGRDARRAFRLR